MKKLISVLSSVCLSATTLLTAFTAIPASAADGDVAFEFTADGAAAGADGNVLTLEDTGSAQTVEVQWKVSNAQAMAGIQMTFDFGGLTLENADTSGLNMMAMFNKEQYILAAVTSDPVTPADGTTLATFTVTVPAGEGTYTLGEEANPTHKKNQVRPLEDADPDIGYTFTSLTIEVKGSTDTQPTETAPPSESTDTPSQTTTTTTAAGGGGGNQGQQLPQDAKPQVQQGSIQLDLTVNDGREVGFNASSNNNVVKGKPGESITVQWTITQDVGICGYDMEFDFGTLKGTYAAGAASVGLAVWGEEQSRLVCAGSANTAPLPDGSVLATFTFTLPTAAGTYTLKEDTARTQRENEVLTIDGPDTKDVSYEFFGLDIIVEGEEESTTTTTTTTAATPSGSDSSTTTTTTTTTTPSGSTTTTTSSDTTTSTTPIGNPAWYMIETKVAPGATVAMPVYVSSDPGTAGFVAKFNFNQALTLNDMSVGTSYEGPFTFNPMDATKRAVAVWVAYNGLNQVAQTNVPVLYLNFTAPTAPGEYEVNFESVDAANSDGQSLEEILYNGKIIVDDTLTTDSSTTTSTTTGSSDSGSGSSTTTTTTTTAAGGSTDSTPSGSTDNGSTDSSSSSSTETTSTSGSGGSGTAGSGGQTNTDTNPLQPGETMTVTSISFTFTPPTRVNYWSHDTRTFQESGGLEGLSVTGTVYTFNVNHENKFVDASGNVLSDANGEFVYDPHAAQLSVTPAQAVSSQEGQDFTANTRPDDDHSTPEKVFATRPEGTIQNKFTLELFYYPDGSTTGTKVGEHTIYIGVKGDMNLNNGVDIDDATKALEYYNAVTVSGGDPPSLSDVAEYDGVNGLIFFLGDVDYLDDEGNPVTPTPDTMTIDDATGILTYYNTETVSGGEATWEDAVGYDFPDDFKH